MEHCVKGYFFVKKHAATRFVRRNGFADARIVLSAGGYLVYP